MEIAKAGQKQAKKPTNAQLQRRIDNAVLHVDKTKDTRSVFFDDRGIRITVNEDCATLSNGMYTTIFQRYYFRGETNQYLSLKAMVECAEKHMDKIVVKDKKGESHISYKMLDKIVNESQDENYSWFTIMSWYIFNIESDLALSAREEFTNAVFYSIYEKYAHNVAAMKQFVEEHKDGMTTRGYFKAISEELVKIADGMPDDMMFEAKSDEERAKEAVEAMSKDADEQILEEQANGEQQVEG